LFSVQGNLLKDNMQTMLSTSARISELSAQLASEAAEKLTLESREPTRARRRGT